MEVKANSCQWVTNTKAVVWYKAQKAGLVCLYLRGGNNLA
jgi:hypothetical protein